LPKKLNENILYLNKIILNMAFSDSQIFEAIEKNVDVKECFNKIREACKELKINTDCPDDDVDRFLEFTIGKWQ
tara:strand:+ start:163 stop:384 length:222 start_codon:yes stop_codon:yes gene_type:complete